MKEFKAKYRIKTKEEFIKDFGDGWRHKVICSFTTDMDKLLGQELTEHEEKQYLKHSYESMCCMGISSWSISTGMITEIKPIDKQLSTQKVSLNDSLYRRKRVNLNQNN